MSHHAPNPLFATVLTSVILGSTLCVLLVLTPSAAGAQPYVAQFDDYQHVSMVLEIQDPTGVTEAVIMAGIAQMEVVFEGTQAGDAIDDDANLLDEVTARMQFIQAAGYSPTLGHVLFTADTTPGVTGDKLEEVVNLVSGRLDLPPFSPSGQVNCDVHISPVVHWGGIDLHPSTPYLLSGVQYHEPAGPLSNLGGFFEYLVDPSGVPTGWMFRVHSLRLSPPTLEHEYEHAVMMLELNGPTGSEIVQLTGLTAVATLFDGYEMGQAEDDDLDLLEEVPTQITGLSLHGASSLFGPLQLELETAYRTTGQVEELTDLIPRNLDLEPFGPIANANSFFDVYFKLQLGGTTIWNREPNHISGPLSALPAHPADGLVGGPVVLLTDLNGLPTGFSMRVDYLRLNPPLETDHFEQASAELRLGYPTGQHETVFLSGRASIQTLFEGAVMGAASDNDRNSLDDVATEIVSLELHGETSSGPLDLRLATTHPSMGRIEELSNFQNWWLDLPPFNEGGNADSFFDVYVEVDAGGQSGATDSPMRISGTVAYKPSGPGDRLFGSNTVALLDELGRPTGMDLRLDVLTLGPITTSVDPRLPPASRLVDLRAAPNPFNPRVQLTVHVTHAGPARLQVYDARGRLVATLLDGLLPAGDHTIFWDGRDAQGRSVVSGVYHLKLDSVDGIATRKLALVR